MGALHRELALRSADGMLLSGHRWEPARAIAAEVLVVHGYAEHGGRYRELAAALAGAGIATTAVDLRGHGRSGGPRGFVRHFDDYHEDVRAALAVPGDAPTFLLGHSLGGLIALDFVARSPVARRLAGVVAVSPYLALAMHVPLAKQLVDGLAAELWPQLALPSGLDPASLSRDRAVVEAYRRDPLVFGHTTAGWYREVTAAQRRVTATSAVELPLLYYFSESDPIASGLVSRSFAEGLACPDKTVRQRRWALHEILNEIERDEVHEEIRAWILAHSAARVAGGERASG